MGMDAAQWLVTTVFGMFVVIIVFVNRSVRKFENDKDEDDDGYWGW